MLVINSFNLKDLMKILLKTFTLSNKESKLPKNHIFARKDSRTISDFKVDLVYNKFSDGRLKGECE